MLVATMSTSDFTGRFAKNLRRIRVDKGMSQEQLADAAGLHRTHISLIERDHRSVRLETLERLAIALDVEPSELIPPLRSKDTRRNGPP